MTVPTSNKHGSVATKLVIVDFPTPALPKNTLPVNFPSHEFVTIPLLSGKISDARIRSPIDTELIRILSSR